MTMSTLCPHTTNRFLTNCPFERIPVFSAITNCSMYSGKSRSMTARNLFGLVRFEVIDFRRKRLELVQESNAAVGDFFSFEESRRIQRCFLVLNPQAIDREQNGPHAIESSVLPFLGIKIRADNLDWNRLRRTLADRGF